jgi:dCMP deaminase
MFQNIFLRWDRMITLQEHQVSPDRIISREEFDKKIMHSVNTEAEKSPDWWRWNGAIVIKDGKEVLRGHNKHMPTNHNPNVFGDPRSNFDAGERPDIYTSIHAEASVIAQAAKEGISLKGTAMYMTTFPCSVCARSIVEAGVKEIYYLKGYSRVDAEDLLKQHDVKIVMVKMD